MPISASVPAGMTVNWYDAPVDGNLLLTNSATYSPQTSGTYYAEAETINGGCLFLNRTPVIVDYLQVPSIQDEDLSFCENTNIELHADTNIPTATYLWSTGAISEAITISTSGIYTIAVTNVNCTVTKTIEVLQIDNPIIDNIDSDGNNMVITTSNTGDFLYALNGNPYQSNNTFLNIEGGIYTVHIKHRSCDAIITEQYLHFYIPKFFTPNNDGINDEFDLKGIEFYNTSEDSIFNRYGKLIKISRNLSFSWDGTFKNQQMPTDDYWYTIVIDGQKFTGHFTLKR